ncbi:hypothetical protein PALU110988_09390 [Paenibacillus lupini]|uniref:hypothetical protein n=1 Tax=Paenibacillus lupini TaxID=1450204 RepID=UPI0014230955|nr:hypothetical protein [Paenibacillus lupini]NIK22032.1 hypothetical protein [Paenibacillus lupini]
MNSKSVVISGTDILGHIIIGGIFNVLVPNVIEEIYITPQIEKEFPSIEFFITRFCTSVNKLDT